MAKTTPQYVCTDCGESFPKWMGKCNACNAWNTLKEFHEAKLPDGKKMSQGVDLAHISSDNKTREWAAEVRISSGISEVDRVLGGGFFPGSVTLFGGNPGVGKSTLALQMFAAIPKALYFSGEESVGQVENRAKRISEKFSVKSDQCIFSTHRLEDIIQTIESHRPLLAVIDSIQMVGLEGSGFGQMSQLRQNAEILVKLAKSSGTALLVIGHMTKNDDIAGPRMLEHLVDTVLALEGERTTDLRILRSPKNRFGSTMEVGVFQMQSEGLTELANPSDYFLAERPENASGSAITVVREGSRNFLLEIQALTVKTNFGLPKRTAHGLNISKLHLLLAVISKFTPFPCHEFDAYLNVVGGIRIDDPASDLAICASLLSSRMEKEIPAHMILLGEVGLSGEVRSVPYLEMRLKEAAKLGFKKAIVPKMREKISGLKNLEIQEVRSVKEALRALSESH